MTIDNLIIGKRYSVSSNNDCVITDTATGYALASISAGAQAVIVPISDSITSDNDCVILPVDEATVMPGVGQGGNGGETQAYVTWGGENNTEVTLNIPDDVDIPLTFNLVEQITSIKGNAGGKTNFKAFCNAAYNLAHFDLTMNNAINCNSLLCSTEKLKSVTLNLPNATDISDLLSYSTGLEDVYIYAPLPTRVTDLITYCQKLKTLTLITPLITDFPAGREHKNLTSITINIASVNTVNASALTLLENVTILEGGLASCTSFNVSASTNLTDTSIQNIINALPDHSSTGTSALVKFPPDRLTAEQQTQLTNKGWTWS